MSTRRISVVVASVVVGGLAAPAFAQRIEISKDGTTVAEIRPSPTDGLVTISRTGVPYGTTPNWQNNLRRQVAALAIADMNGDGHNDLVVGCYSSNSFPPYTDWENLIYYNTGTQLETNPSWISADEVSTSDVQVGDINRDGFLDIFAANGNGLADNVIYYGSATGPDPNPDWVSNEPLNCWTNAAILFDYDHDGDLDVVTGNQAVSPDPYRPIYAFRNNNGALNPVPDWSSAESSIQGGLDFADYDGDGWEDLAVSKWANFATGIYKNVNGTLQTTPIWTTGDTGTDRGALWADFDNNGWPDLVVGHNPPRMYANTAGVLTLVWQANTNSSAPQDMRVHDVDFDHRPDYAEIQFSSGIVRIHRNVNGALETTPSWQYDSPGAGSALAFGDIDGDGYDDLVVGNSGQPCIFVFYATAPAYCTGDLNCDGTIDFGDIDPFVLALSGEQAYLAQFPNCRWLNADANGDNTVDFADIDAFVGLLFTACP